MLSESAGLSYPQWSPDGRYLACQQSDSMFQVVGSNKLMLFDFATRQWTELSDQRAEGQVGRKMGSIFTLSPAPQRAHTGFGCGLVTTN
jgi:hypothetical protein